MITQTNNPFLTKIIFEPQAAENESFGIVADIDPVVPGHYMLFSKQWHKSIADCDFEAAVQLAEEKFPQVADKPYAYFERGRASFCTSMDGVVHGHGHLVPAFVQDMSELFPFGAVERYPSMLEAYRHINAEDQYLLWGNLGKEFFVLQNAQSLPKRTIRKTIQSYTNQM